MGQGLEFVEELDHCIGQVRKALVLLRSERALKKLALSGQRNAESTAAMADITEELPSDITDFAQWLRGTRNEIVSVARRVSRAAKVGDYLEGDLTMPVSNKEEFSRSVVEAIVALFAISVSKYLKEGFAEFQKCYKLKISESGSDMDMFRQKAAECKEEARRLIEIAKILKARSGETQMTGIDEIIQEISGAVEGYVSAISWDGKPSVEDMLSGAIKEADDVVSRRLHVNLDKEFYNGRIAGPSVRSTRKASQRQKRRRVDASAYEEFNG